MRAILPLCLVPYLALAALIISKEPLLGVAFLAAPLLGGFIFCKPLWSLALIFFCIPFDRTLIILPDRGLTITKVLILLTLGTWIGRSLLARDTNPIEAVFGRWAGVLALTYLSLSCVSMFFAPDFEIATAVFSKRLNVVVFFLMTIGMIRDQITLDRCINAMLFGCFFVTLIGLYEYLTHEMFLEQTKDGTELAVTIEGATRIQACAGDSNFHAAILVLILPFVLTRLLQAKTWTGWACLLVFVGLCVLNLIATNTRQGMLGMIIAFTGIVLLPHLSLKPIRLAAGGVFVAAILGVMLYGSNEVAVGRYTGDTGMKSVEYRLGWIEMSFDMAWEHPILGRGIGGFFADYGHYWHRYADHVPSRPHANHNGFMQLLAEHGLVGTSLHLLLLAVVGWSVWGLVQSARLSFDLHVLSIGVLLSFVAYIMLIGIIPMLEHEVGWIVMAFAVVLRRIHGDKLEVAATSESEDRVKQPMASPRLAPAV